MLLSIAAALFACTGSYDGVDYCDSVVVTTAPAAGCETEIASFLEACLTHQDRIPKKFQSLLEFDGTSPDSECQQCVWTYGGYIPGFDQGVGGDGEQVCSLFGERDEADVLSFETDCAAECDL